MEVVITSGTDGKVDSGSTTGLATAGAAGKLVKIEHTPLGGTSQPTADWDLYITDQHDLALASDEGCSNTATELMAITTTNGVDYIEGPLKVRAANMGDAKKAIIRFYFDT